MKSQMPDEFASEGTQFSAKSERTMQKLQTSKSPANTTWAEAAEIVSGQFFINLSINDLIVVFNFLKLGRLRTGSSQNGHFNFGHFQTLCTVLRVILNWFIILF